MMCVYSDTDVWHECDLFRALDIGGLALGGSKQNKVSDPAHTLPVPSPAAGSSSSSSYKAGLISFPRGQKALQEPECLQLTPLLLMTNFAPAPLLLSSASKKGLYVCTNLQLRSHVRTTTCVSARPPTHPIIAFYEGRAGAFRCAPRA